MNMDINDYIDKKLFHEIHTSERKSFRGCRRRWDWHFRESLYPLTTAKPLEFGTAYHIGMEVYYNPETWAFDNEVKMQLAVKAFVESCEAQRKHALEQNIFYDAEVEQDYNERVELGKGMLQHYCTNVAPKEDIGLTPVKVEIAFIVPIPNPETGEEIIWCRCSICKERWSKHLDKSWGDISSMPIENMKAYDDRYWERWKGLPVVYAGRVDALFVDKFGNYWIVDWKTTKNITKEEDTVFLELDDQIGSYPWALRKLGLQIQGFIYHEQRKGFPQRPHENVNRRKGCKFSVSKTQEVDFETYLKTVTREDTDAWADGCYDDFLAYLKDEGIVYYSRRQIVKTREEDLSTEFNIGLEALDMIDPKVRLYPSPSRFACKNCAFRVPCIEKNSGGDYTYALKTLYNKQEHYYVRKTEGPSTESNRND